MQPEIDVLGISIKTFGIMFALGFLAAGAVLARRLREQGRPVDWAYEVIFFGLIGGLVGSRLYYLIQHPGQFRDDPLGSAFGGTGLVWYGGAIGGGGRGGGGGVRGGVFQRGRRRPCGAP